MRNLLLNDEGQASPNAGQTCVGKVEGLPYKDKKTFAKYSSVDLKQRLGIANAILHDPELLILDEPTNGLDPIGIAEVRDFIKKLKCTQAWKDDLNFFSILFRK